MYTRLPKGKSRPLITIPCSDSSQNHERLVNSMICGSASESYWKILPGGVRGLVPLELPVVMLCESPSRDPCIEERILFWRSALACADAPSAAPPDMAVAFGPWLAYAWDCREASEVLLGLVWTNAFPTVAGLALVGRFVSPSSFPGGGMPVAAASAAPPSRLCSLRRLSAPVLAATA
eukprot:COSAG02_NODE_10419_length_1945_cov_2.839112_1_plen_177_part_10